MNKNIQFLKQKFTEKPLLVIMIVAIIPRLIAAIFAKGYGMHDDAFLPVQTMQEMLDNFDVVYNNAPNLLLYPLMQYFTFAICEFFNIFDPQIKMYVVRFLHSIYSLLTVYLGYKITLKISNEKNAKYVGIILALLWMLPYMSVRNLVEVVVMPPMLAGIYYILKYNLENKNNTEHLDSSGLEQNNDFKQINDFKQNKQIKQSSKKYLIIAGIFLGIAFSIRFQSAFVPFGIGLVMLYQRQFKSFAILTLSAIFISSLFLGIFEYILWEKPFWSLINYWEINTGADVYTYPTNSWYMTTVLVIGVLIPPMSLFWLFGYLRTWKEHLLLFLPVLLFLIFHSAYPNKQERFILTIIPLLVILCVIGWNNFVEKSEWWNRHKKFLKGQWIWFWSINTILLLVFIFSYSKRTRVESFTYLSHKQVTGIVIEMNEDGTYFPPIFYLGENRNKPLYLLYKNYEALEFEQQFNEKGNPNYVIFFDENELQSRVERFEKNYHCDLIFEKEIGSGLIDRVLHFTNPKHNKNYTAYIYEVVK